MNHKLNLDPKFVQAEAKAVVPFDAADKVFLHPIYTVLLNTFACMYICI